MTMNKILPIAYGDNSARADDFILDEFHFDGKDKFLIVSSKEIPKNSRVYFEVTITGYPTNPDIRHIPIYVGVHKEPSFGVLAADFCIGSCFYTKNSYLVSPTSPEYLSYVTMERYMSAGKMTYQFINKTSGRVPVKNTVIGVGVDMAANTITIFTDGKKFYSFSPKTFHLNNQNNGIYFAIYADCYKSEIKGYINYGRYRTQYLPSGYFDMYQEYFDKHNVAYEIKSRINIHNAYPNPPMLVWLPGKMDPVNNLAPLDADGHRHVHLIHNHPTTMTYYTDPPANTKVNDCAFMFYKNSTTLADHDLSFINYPVPVRQKVYFELSCKDALMHVNTYGIPLSIGVTKDKNNIFKDAIKIDLFHNSYDSYKVHTYSNGTEYVVNNYSIMNPSQPAQPNTIGVLADLENNTLEIYTDHTIFMSVMFNKTLIDLTDTTNISYMFIESHPEILEDYEDGHVVCNFGDKPLDYTNICDNVNVMSWQYYFNYTIRYYMHIDILFCQIVLRPEIMHINKYLYCTIYSGNDAHPEWSPGLNKLWGTYNIVTDTEEHEDVPEITSFDLNKIIQADLPSNPIVVPTKIPFNPFILSCKIALDPLEFADLDGTFRIRRTNETRDLDGYVYIVPYKELPGTLTVVPNKTLNAVINIPYTDTEDLDGQLYVHDPNTYNVDLDGTIDINIVYEYLQGTPDGMTTTFYITDLGGYKSNTLNIYDIAYGRYLNKGIEFTEGADNRAYTFLTAPYRSRTNYIISYVPRY